MSEQKLFKTKKGTQFPILSLKGKDYLQVAYRIAWFREEHPDWPVITFIEEQDQTHAIIRAEIYNNHGTVLATARKQEHKLHFADFLEKAETGAVGRALAYLGFGTQFAGPELDEGERLADAPLEPKRENVNGGNKASEAGKKETEKKSGTIETAQSSDETYEGSGSQKKELVKTALEFGIEDISKLRELSEYLIGIDMKFLREKIKDFVSLKGK